MCAFGCNAGGCRILRSCAEKTVNVISEGQGGPEIPSPGSKLAILAKSPLSAVLDVANWRGAGIGARGMGLRIWGNSFLRLWNFSTIKGTSGNIGII